MSKIAVIGSGFSGLSAAAYLSAGGHQVHIYEKHPAAGGRARQLRTDNGYIFDMGPSWYWMPDIIDRFFHDFGHTAADFYKLKRLNPAFDVIFANQRLSVPANFTDLCLLFESIETGSAKQLEKFMREAKYKYEKGMKDLAFMPGLSLTEFADTALIREAIRLQIFSSFSKHVRKYFTDPRLISLMEFPVLFLGAMPQSTPALYSLMNYAGLKLGTWYPQGGFGKVVDAMVQVAQKNGALLHFNSPVEKIIIENSRACGIIVQGKKIACEGVVATADYHHVEMELLPESFRNYTEAYWEKKTFAPSCLIFYLGISKRITALEHHTLFFEEDLLDHSREIYKNPQWPTKPLFYVCSPSTSDDAVAPSGHENLFLLMPLAPGLKDNNHLRERYFHIMLNRLQKHIGEEISDHIAFKQSYCVNDFIEDYNAYKGNAYGLANTLAQTALLKPKMRNKKIPNLFYAGQLTVPGPGIPPSLISGKIAAQQLLKHLKGNRHEAFV